MAAAAGGANTDLHAMVPVPPLALRCDRCKAGVGVGGTRGTSTGQATRVQGGPAAGARAAEQQAGSRGAARDAAAKACSGECG